MAYANYNGCVYKNGKRIRKMEHAYPYAEDKPNRLKQIYPLIGIGMYHAIVGSGHFRMCAYKSSVAIYWKHEQIDIDKFIIKNNKTDDTYEYFENGIQGCVKGYKFRAYPSFKNEPECVYMQLEEPNGTLWYGKSYHNGLRNLK